MTGSFAIFEKYINRLAKGELDGYIDSICREDKASIDGFVLSTDPQLLLHGLGKRPDHQRIKNLFTPATVSVIVTLQIWRQLMLFLLFQQPVLRLWWRENPSFP
jgi:hypothetical protein